MNRVKPFLFEDIKKRYKNITVKKEKYIDEL